MLHGVKLGLANIQFLLGHDGNPHLRYPTVHVAGTNGKGSTVAILDAMLRAAGYRTGRFTSPHLIDVTERFQVDGVPVSGAQLDASIHRFRAIATTMDRPPTFFEMNTAIAFHLFAQAKAEAGIIEVGMGGRLDSTNVVAPEATAITSIALEHTQYLGNTLEKIAFEKAGIIKPGVPVVVAEEQAGPRDVILARAAVLGSEALLIGRDFRYALEGSPWQPGFSYESGDLNFGPVPLGLAGPYQGPNAAVATTLARLIRPKFPRLDESAIMAGLENVRWPCRLERVLDDPPVIVDTTHTVAGAQYLRQVFDKAITVLTVCSDKPARDIIAELAPFTEKFVLTQFEGKRAMPIGQLREAAAPYQCVCVESMGEAIAEGISLAGPGKPLLITGSVFAAGEARHLLATQFGAEPLRFL
jgi:dihydrofolate synthase/folylpolyglutamate synthase